MKYQIIALLGDTHGMKEIVKTVLIIKYSNDAYVALSCYLGVPSLISSRFYIKTPFSKKKSAIDLGPVPNCPAMVIPLFSNMDMRLGSEGDPSLPASLMKEP